MLAAAAVRNVIVMSCWALTGASWTWRFDSVHGCLSTLIAFAPDSGIVHGSQSLKICVNRCVNRLARKIPKHAF